MYEKAKLMEAGFFLGQMNESVNEPDAFQYHLSAFLSAARSVLQYALEEAKKKPQGQQWYDKQVDGNAVLKFFKDKRDVNIHVEPVKLTRHVSVAVTANITISESVRIEIRRADGTVEVREHKSEPAGSAAKETEPTMTARYVFADWPGPEDVIALSRAYLNHLSAFVQSAFQAQVISG